MKIRSKTLLALVCAVLLVASSVLGTMAYLTSQDQVINSFSVGSVALTLDEKNINDLEGSRVKANTYHLMPGHEYVKDPTVHVDSKSEDSWIFVKVENGIAAYEATSETTEGGYKTIADQITAKGWTALGGVDGVYYKEYTNSNTGADLVVFENFKIADNANDVNGWSNITTENTKVNVTAYAVQKDGFTTASAAWNATFGKTAD